jgi:hypothetical protein
MVETRRLGVSAVKTLTQRRGDAEVRQRKPFPDYTEQIADLAAKGTEPESAGSCREMIKGLEGLWLVQLGAT